MNRLFYKKRLSELRATIQPESHQSPQPLPNPIGPKPYHLDLANVLSIPPSDIEMTFHMLGDVGGVKNPCPQQSVANAMEQDFASNNPLANNPLPSFAYVVGDVVYFVGAHGEYYSQLYEPYVHYPAPFFAIPGNHDGETDKTSNSPSLDGFMENFCNKEAKVTQDAMDVPRAAMTQPNCYWTLTSPLATIIGLYSNVPSSAYFDQDQKDWFLKELQTAPTDRALIVTVHHPPFSLDAYHSGNQNVFDLLMSSYKAAYRIPDIVFSGHVHNMQRLTYTNPNGTKTPYVVVGNSGYHNLHVQQRLPDGSPLPTPFQVSTNPSLTLENYCDNKYGYCLVTVSKKILEVKFFTVIENCGNTTPAFPAQLFDSVSVDLPY